MMTTTSPVSTSTRFAYIVEGEVSVGDVSDYVRAIEAAHYAGLDVSRTVWTVGEDGASLVPMTVTTRSTGFDDDDFATLTVEIEFVKDDPETASVRIDGRA